VAVLYSLEIFLVLFSVIGKFDLNAIVRQERSDEFKKKNHDIDNRTRDLPAFSKVPDPTTLSRAHFYESTLCKQKSAWNKGTTQIP
jgi:hypothetical protein